MLRTLYFYGATGGALTFLDPYTGTAVTEVPVVGTKDTVAMRGALAWTDTPTFEEFANIKIGAEGDYHDIQLICKGDADNVTSDIGDQDVVPLGDFIVKEGSAISGTAPATGNCAGMIMYEDGEPEIPMPEGRHVFLRVVTSGDIATTLAATNITQPNTTKALSVESEYYVYAATTLPEDKVIQAFILKTSGGMVACAPPKGRIVYPSCPMKFNGKEKLAALGQVQAGAEGGVIWELIEVPLGSTPVGGTEVRSGLTSGGSLKTPSSGFQANLSGGISFGKFR